METVGDLNKEDGTVMPPEAENSNDDSWAASVEPPGGELAIPAPEASDKEIIEEVIDHEEVSLIRKNILTLALPALAEMILMTLVSMADMIMVGRLGPWAITSVGLSNQPMFVAMSMFMALNVGATALVARSIGANRPEDASAAARQAVVIAGAMGLILGILGYMNAPSIIAWMGAEADVIGPGSSYLKIVACGLLFQGVTISLSASLRGAGDTKTPMSVNTVANLVNVFFNYLLIYGHFGFPRMEVAGAALATTISRGVGCALIIRKILLNRAAIKISIHDSFRPDPEIMRRIFRVGLPAAMEQAVMRSGQMAFARIVSSFGTTVYAAHQVALNVEGLSFTPGQAFQIATTSLVGQSLGAKRPKRAMRTGWEALKIGAAVAVLVGLVYFFFGKYVAYLYTDDRTVTELAAGALRIIAVAQPFMIGNFILSGGLRGAGDTKWTLYITAAGIWGVRVVLAYILAIKMGMGLPGAWIGMAMDMSTRAILAALRFRAGHWAKIEV